MASLLKCCLILLFSLGVFAKTPESNVDKFKKEKILIGAKSIVVEIADKPELHEIGLMYRKSLGMDEGMLFIFDTERPLFFWMKNTFIDLSIGYFDKNFNLVDIQEMKATSVLENNPPNYPSAKKAKYALEMNKSWFAKNKIKVGEKFKFLESRQ